MSGNPLELVCEGLVNQREKKEQERKSGEKKKVREKERADRLLSRAGLFL